MFIVIDPLSSIAIKSMDLFLSNNDTCADKYLKWFIRSIWGGPKKQQYRHNWTKRLTTKSVVKTAKTKQ